jgi:parallel beta-helix repeat protein
MLTLIFNFQLVKPEPTTIIVPDDYLSIDDAINAANPRDTIFVRCGIYGPVGFYTLHVNKPVTLVGEETSDSLHYPVIMGVISITANNVSISKFITAPSWFPSDGIHLWSVTGCRVSQMVFCVDEGTGIWLHDSSYNVIAYNRVEGVVWDGMRLIGSSNNTLIGNYFDAWAGEGVQLLNSNNNVMIGNNIEGGHNGISLSSSSNNKILHNNFINNQRQARSWDNLSVNI